ncbi:hypothetical protein C8F04DRAFT_1198973 [Mycena alexandri]|uniref:Uncharacterized protein n=1 Tax=Mycena alexandri TaxID=1745969 RepID=A0AAD6WMX3_9AGAR|nr:hypothetical protein C8F04DRAFT_1198973 [Mycena alexandri]
MPSSNYQCQSISGAHDAELYNLDCPTRDGARGSAANPQSSHPALPANTRFTTIVICFWAWPATRRREMIMADPLINLKEVPSDVDSGSANNSRVQVFVANCANYLSSTVHTIAKYEADADLPPPPVTPGAEHTTKTENGLMPSASAPPASPATDRGVSAQGVVGAVFGKTVETPFTEPDIVENAVRQEESDGRPYFSMFLWFYYGEFGRFATSRCDRKLGCRDMEGSREDGVAIYNSSFHSELRDSCSMTIL